MSLQSAIAFPRALLAPDHRMYGEGFRPHGKQVFQPILPEGKHIEDLGADVRAVL